MSAEGDAILEVIEGNDLPNDLAGKYYGIYKILELGEEAVPRFIASLTNKHHYELERAQEIAPEVFNPQRFEWFLRKEQHLDPQVKARIMSRLRAIHDNIHNSNSQYGGFDYGYAPSYSHAQGHAHAHANTGQNKRGRPSKKQTANKLLYGTHYHQ